MNVTTAQAEIGDLKTALLTAASIPDVTEKDFSGKLITYPFRERTLVEVRARAGDFKGAKEVAQTIDENYHDGYQKGYTLRVIARAEAEAKDTRAAVATADTIQHDFSKAAAYVDIAQAQARAGDRAGAARSFEQALRLAEDVPEVKHQTVLDVARPLLLRTLAAAQAEVGEDKAAQEWIARQSSPSLKVWALVGLAEGLAKRQAAAKQPR
jgi:tetratricopeptide (TPR) repeat protein